MANQRRRLFAKFVVQPCLRLVRTNKFDPEKVFNTFKRHYELVPLEVFGSDPYKTLISTILSARTRDEVTFEVSKKLFKIAPNMSRLRKLNVNELEKIIRPVGFYKTKARHLRDLSRMVDGVPNDFDGLMKL